MIARMLGFNHPVGNRILHRFLVITASVPYFPVMRFYPMRLHLLATSKPYEELFRRSLLLSTVFLLVISLTISTYSVLDSDMGWHLRTGQWIFSHGTLPLTDPFSVSGQGKPWIAYSWLFEIILALFHESMGLVGIVAFTSILGVLIALALLSLLADINPSPEIVTGLGGLGIFTMSPILQTPRPWLFSILFFIIELKILLSVSRNRDIRRLALLIPIFWLWSNLQIQFIYGLLLLLIYLIEPWASSHIMQHRLPLKNRPVWDLNTTLILALCFLVTLAGPYHFKLYTAIYDVVLQTGVYLTISEMQAVPFRNIQDWLFLMTAIWSAYLLGRQPSITPFLIIIYLGGLFVAFRSQRDTFFLIVPALAIIAARLHHPDQHPTSVFTRSQQIGAGLILAALAAILVQIKDINTTGLNKAIAESYPASAVYVVKLRNLPGPLYNNYDLGGFLMWQLPEYQIGIDGRANFYGDNRIARHSNTLSGKHDWRDDEELSQARLVILRRDDALSSILKLDGKFELLFEDEIASLFVARTNPTPEFLDTVFRNADPPKGISFTTQ